ncbi:hypothetical protein CHIBA101_2159 [Actinomyces sp. Chiba101]|uniref:hypothetical protein n=1 Tax=Actinomyces TaxID=1654 RepID=UPI000974E6BD|nr:MULTISPECIES: hypothetical protein [Actinomyces]BAW93987.1 hypothetical protein CHIBA101_2159 [Actinomyces sp. Chiba101]GAV93307.1 hypothetical protein ADENT20671_0049 [Actinomyces denticolens]SUU74487.1 Uncharacterised protein [Actinomyces denticolens]
MAAGLPLALAALPVLPFTSPAAHAADAQGAAGEVTIASPKPLPTAQINGVVWDQEIVGNTVYAVGEFSSARPAGSSQGENETPRSNAMAYDITTGALLDWAPTTNGVIYSIDASKDGKTLYLGGNFTRLNDESTFRLGAVSASDGKRVSLGISPNTEVRDVEVSPDGATLYFSGAFTQVNNQARYRVAAVSLPTLSLTNFSPRVGRGLVRTVTVASDGTQVAIGGSFSTVGGSSNPGLAIIGSDGAVKSTNINSVVRNSGTYAAIFSLKSDGQGLYGVAYSQEGTFEGMFRANWATGDLDYMADCHGDTYDVFPAGGVAYIAGHPHDCSNIGGFSDTSPKTYYNALAYVNGRTGTVQRNHASGYTNYSGQPATTALQSFRPDFIVGSYTGMNQATWTVEGNDKYVVYGGEFIGVNKKGQQGLVRFAIDSKEVPPQGEGDDNGGQDNGWNNNDWWNNGGGNGRDDDDDDQDNGNDGWNNWGWNNGGRNDRWNNWGWNGGWGWR